MCLQCLTLQHCTLCSYVGLDIVPAKVGLGLGWWDCRGCRNPIMVCSTPPLANFMIYLNFLESSANCAAHQTSVPSDIDFVFCALYRDFFIHTFWQTYVNFVQISCCGYKIRQCFTIRHLIPDAKTKVKLLDCLLGRGLFDCLHKL